MRPLNLKLFRDLWQIKGQALAISMVIAAGVAMYIAYISTFQSLDLTQETYYQRFRFGDVFASLKRAPLRLQERPRSASEGAPHGRGGPCWALGFRPASRR